MSTFKINTSNIEDLDLDFSDRKFESPNGRRGLNFEFRLQESESEASTASESEVEECDLDDEYFFDHRLDFGHYLPPKTSVPEAKSDPVLTNGFGEHSGDVSKTKTRHNSIQSSGSINSSHSSELTLNGDTSYHLDVNKNQAHVIQNGDIDVKNVNGLDLDTLTSAVERFSVAARRNDREEIRKKLAFGADDDSYDDNDDEESVDDASYKKGTLQSRLHSGLQICFMNESPCDTDNEGISPRPHELHDNTKHMMQKDDVLVDSDNNLSTVEDLNHPCTSSTVDHSSGPPRLKPVLQPETSDFQTRQEQLQNEAKVALAQAGSMAHMQLEIERQTKKKSPIAEMAGIPGLGERRRKKLSPRQLQQMNLAQTQVLYNDLQTQIESLNEELVHLLMERDELHMEQDSMLVDIEDLTRRAEELAEKANRDGKTKTCCIQGQLPR